MKKLKCLRCQHTWYPRSPKKPTLCPSCKSKYWNIERTKDMSKDSNE